MFFRTLAAFAVLSPLYACTPSELGRHADDGLSAHTDAGRVSVETVLGEDLSAADGELLSFTWTPTVATEAFLVEASSPTAVVDLVVSHGEAGEVLCDTHGGAGHDTDTIQACVFGPGAGPMLEGAYTIEVFAGHGDFDGVGLRVEDTRAETALPTVEGGCDDGIDEDADELTDCDDDDCADAIECTWASEVLFETHIAFDAGFVARVAGHSDCNIHTAVDMQRDLGAEVCEGCDRMFAGSIDYLSDDCPDTDDFQRPLEGVWGVTFDAADAWTITFRDDANGGAWTELGQVVDDGSGLYSLEKHKDVKVAGVTVGEVDMAFHFRRP